MLDPFEQQSDLSSLGGSERDHSDGEQASVSEFAASDANSSYHDEEEDEASSDGDDYLDDDDDDEWTASGRKRKGTARRKVGRPRKYRKRTTAAEAAAIVALATTPQAETKRRILGTISLAPVHLPTGQSTALGALTPQQIQAMSPRQRAKRLLHVGATPESLPCRQDQFDEVMACLEDAVQEGMGGCIYISGVPGTGKTATVREVVRTLRRRAEEGTVRRFHFVEINGMKLQDAQDAYGVLWHALTGHRCSNAVALPRLAAHFGARQANQSVSRGSNTASDDATTVVLMDELDQLVTTRQDVMYNMFNWPNGVNSRLVVVAVANTMDLPERVLQARVASRLGMTRITFRPYTDRELVEIVHARLGIQQGAVETSSDKAASLTEGCDTVFTSEALVYLAKRVSNVSGDARRMLDVCRQAIDAIDELEATLPSTSPSTPITIGDVKRVLDAMVKSSKSTHFSHLALHVKLAMVAVFYSVRRSGLAEVDLGMITSAHANLCRMQAIEVPGSHSDPIQTSLTLSTPALLLPDDNLGGLTVVAHLLSRLCALGLLIAVGNGTSTARSGRFARYVLAWGEDEIRSALEQDADPHLRNLL